MLVRVLGSVAAGADLTTLVEPPGLVPSAVLAHLALARGHVLTVDALADRIWDEDLPDNARNSVQAAVSRLRRVLPDGLVQSSRAGYRLAIEQVTVDWLEAEREALAARASLAAGDLGAAAARAETGLQWFTGRPLAGLESRACGAARVRAEELRLSLVAARAEALLAGGRAGDVVAQLRETVEENPLAEPVHGLLMRALAADGRPGEALTVYDQLRRRLADELGTDPSAELAGIFTAILAGEPQAPPRQDRPPETTAAVSSPHTVGLLLTDVEGSTRLWKKFPDVMATVMLAHHDLVADVVAEHRGRLPPDQGEGDARLGVFPSPAQAVAAAAVLQRRLAELELPAGIQLRVRAGVHAGTVVESGGNVFGAAVHRCARIRGLAHGGQVLVSGVAGALARPQLSGQWQLHPLGHVPLQDFDDEEEVFQLDPAGTQQAFPPLRTTVRLPGDVASFVGRHADVERLLTELGNHRLVTLTGLGGSGKTRLAVHAARVATPDFTGGVTFVDLAAATSVGEALDAVAACLHLEGLPGNTAERISERLVPSSLLLLDNVEQIPDAHTMVSGLLDAGSATLLVTSRFPVGLPGEVVRPVEPLSDPDAVALLLDRAADVVPGLVPDAAAAVELVRLLDGVPLAIELAAARLRVLDLSTLVQIITGQLTVLSDPTGGRPQRHRSVTALLADAWEQLSPPAHQLLTALSVFRTGAPVGPAADVSGLDAAEVLDLLAELLDRGLVIAEHSPDAGPRFRVLDLIRRYAQSRADPAALLQIRHRHALHVVELVQRAPTNAPTNATPRHRDDLREAIRTITAADPHPADVEPLELSVDQRLAVGRAALGLGWWPETVALLDPISPHPPAANPLGVALLRRDESGDTERGRRLLAQAATAGDADAAATLGGSYKSTDPARAYDWYLKALSIDPGDPYSLGNVIEHEVTQAGSLDLVAHRRDQLLAGIVRRRAQAARGEDVPWPWYDLAKFQLLVGDDQDALHCLLEAVAMSTHERQLLTSVTSLKRMTVPGASPAWTTATTILELATEIVFPVEGPSPPATGLARPVVVLAGASAHETHEQVMAWLAPLAAALPSSGGTMISGGTCQGVSALAAALAADLPGWRSIGYLPVALPDGVSANDGYDELRRTAADDFGLTEPLAYWTDLHATGIAASEVRVLGIGGGSLTGFELHLAAALGAAVAVADQAFDAASSAAAVSPLWAAGLTRVRPDADALRSWFST
jgi:predicted ATPase/class 3 adenylate cyclase